MKIMVCGHGGHGKDQFCEFLGMQFTSSSRVALDKVIWDAIGHGFADKDECYELRGNHRSVWYSLIKDYNTPDTTRLCRDIFKDKDVYCGIRDREEFLQAKKEGLFDISIWVDASGRVPPESSSSCTLLKSDCDIVIDNNGTLAQLEEKAATIRPLLISRPTPLRKLITDWADSVFPERTVQNAVQKFLMEEMPEYLLDRGNPLELGDLGVLLYDIAHLDGVDLDEAIRSKMVINANRTWAIDPTTGLLNHTNREDQEPPACRTGDEQSGFGCINCRHSLTSTECSQAFCPHCSRLMEISRVRVEHPPKMPSRLPSPVPVQEDDTLNTDNPTAKCPNCEHLNPVNLDKQRELMIHGDTRFWCTSCDKRLFIKVVQGVNHVRLGYN